MSVCWKKRVEVMQPTALSQVASPHIYISSFMRGESPQSHCAQAK